MKGDALGLHFAANVFLATVVLWLVLRRGADTNPIWAIASMIATSEPQLEEPLHNFRAALIIAVGLEHHAELSGVEVGLRRVGEVLLGCLVGLAVAWAMSKVWPVATPTAAPVKEGGAGPT